MAGVGVMVVPGMGVMVVAGMIIVVVLGGPGSLKGAALGSVLIGMVDTYGTVIAPQYAQVTIYALMALVLLFKPAGLIPVRATHRR